MTTAEKIQGIVDAGTCVGCGACVVLAIGGTAKMRATQGGPVPSFDTGETFSDIAWTACPGKGVDYPELYRQHFGNLPEDWRVGIVNKMWTGFACDQVIRRAGASGGVTSRVLIHLLETGRVDGVVLARQDLPIPGEARLSISNQQSRINSQQSATTPSFRPFDIPWMVLDASLAERICGWKPATPISEVLEEIARHAEAHPNWLDLVA